MSPATNRLKPEPIPTVYPVAEYAVMGERAQWYAEMKEALQVPWMGVVTMAFAHYPEFFRELWRGLKPLVTSRPFVEEALALQALVEERVTALNPPPIGGRLAEMGYGVREITGIRAANDVFSHGNHAYALIATIARMLMEGDDMAGPQAPLPVFEGRHAPGVAIPFVLMEAHHADEPTQAVFEDLKEVLGLPFVNTDYRAFARWPSYWAAAWGDLREVAGTPAHEAICREYHDRLVAAVGKDLPNPGGLTAEILQKASETDASAREVTQICRLFQWLLPGLAANVAYLKFQLSE